MDMPNITVYVETTIKQPSKGQAAGAWLVEYITGSDRAVIRKGGLYRWETTENALVLELIRDALSILTKPCSAWVNTQCGHVLSAVQKHWMRQWKEEGWKNAKGRPVKNAELWQQAEEQMRKHCVSFDCRRPDSQYLEIMQTEMAKALEEAVKGKRREGQQMSMFK